MGDEVRVSPEFVRGGQSNDALKLSLIRKVSPDGWLQESIDRWVPTIPNSFGLPAEQSCPGRTPWCAENCYAENSENSKGVNDLVDHNLELLMEAGLNNTEAMTPMLRGLVTRFDTEAKRKKVSPEDMIFKIGWDGDFPTVEYARAWAIVMNEFPYVRFWAYTRSYTEEVNVIPEFEGLTNFQLYLSADKWNVDLAHERIDQYSEYSDWLHIAECAEDEIEGRELARGRNTKVCPENLSGVLMHNGRGACVSCKLCIKGEKDVIFITSRKRDAEPQLQLPVDKASAFVIALRVSIGRKPSDKPVQEIAEPHPSLFD